MQLAHSIVELLKDGKPRTVPDIALALGKVPENIATIVKRLKELDRVRVSGYRRNSIGHPVKLWVAGKGKDAPKPRSATRAERNAMAVYREKLAEELAARDRANRPMPFRHWQDSVLFGDYSKPFTPQIVCGRIYQQSMDVRDREAA